MRKVSSRHTKHPMRHIKCYSLLYMIIVSSMMSIYQYHKIFYLDTAAVTTTHISNDAVMNIASSEQQVQQAQREDSQSPPLSRSNVMRIMKKMHDGNLINRSYFIFLMHKARALLHSLETVYAVPIEPHQKVTVSVVCSISWITFKLKLKWTLLYS